jgi:hypothetical protein
MIPHKCPVCDGTGLVSYPPGVAGYQRNFTATTVGPWPRHPCIDKGLLREADPEFWLTKEKEAEDESEQTPAG